MDGNIHPKQAVDIHNPYADIFFDYISRSLADSLEAVQAVETALPTEEREQACHILDYGLQSNDAWATARQLTIELSPYIERSGIWDGWHQTLTNAIATAQQAGDVDGEITLRAHFARLLQR